MFRNITLGQYYPAESVLHALDPRVKLFGALIWIISIFLMDGLFSFLLATGFLMFLIIISKVPFSFMVRGLRSIMIIVIIASVFNIFFTPGNTLVEAGPLKITDKGIINAVLMAIRMFYLIIGTSLMTLTTTPNNLTDGLSRSLSPLEKLRVPVTDIAMMMTIALRFIPILIEETNKIMKAQMARGADFEHGGLIKKAKNMVPLLVPLFVSAFRRANDLALAMEARCYSSGKKRTKLNPLKYARRDAIAYIIILLFLTGLILMKIFL
ncbi:MAG: energy-coupling factor transporter transmembrane protein EcfT [Lachnospiraceae bacterium]|nr:energy-coupling factor transporter transmembrane protein EcfT [Lachnospiraceae bacterium]